MQKRMKRLKLSSEGLERDKVDFLGVENVAGLTSYNNDKSAPQS